MMVAFFGQIALLVALFFSLLQTVMPVWGWYRHNPYALACARPSAFAQCFFVACAYLLLTYAFITHDFSIAYVAANSHPLLPWMYRLTALWGAHEGSILLWIFILNGWTVAFTLIQKKNVLLPFVLASLGFMSCCFLIFILLTSNPFLTTLIPQAGRDLNPLLQDPGFIMHPPMLYIGYVGFSVAFAITQAALLQGNLDANWAKTTRQFALAAWCFLTFGILLGSWWAYRVLGWGGFWFWDPVENASLLPWLSGLALIHILVLVEKRDTAKGWATFLALITFMLSLLGTFLVRSGVLISVHTFANDPLRGMFLLCLLAVLMTLALGIYALRISALTSRQHFSFSGLSREMALLLNSGLLFLSTLTILLGTLYPLIIDALKLGTLSVGAPYFNKVMTPLVYLTMLFMAFAPLCLWQENRLNTLWQQAWQRILMSFSTTLFLLWFFVGEITAGTFITLSLCLCVVLNLIPTFSAKRAMSLAHLGFVVLILGIMFSSLLSVEREVRIQPGSTTAIGPYQFSFIDTQGVNGSNYRGIRATFEVTKNNRPITFLYPEKRIYTVREMVMTKVDIHPGIFRDLYIALGEPLDDATWSVRIYYKPFMRWIWLGGIIMMVGGFVAFLPRVATRSKKSLPEYQSLSTGETL
jgi:cytochrome c-type biogenesis protein CcmF